MGRVCFWSDSSALFLTTHHDFLASIRQVSFRSCEKKLSAWPQRFRWQFAGRNWALAKSQGINPFRDFSNRYYSHKFPATGINCRDVHSSRVGDADDRTDGRKREHLRASISLVAYINGVAEQKNADMSSRLTPTACTSSPFCNSPLLELKNEFDSELDLPLRDCCPRQQACPTAQRPIGQEDI